MSVVIVGGDSLGKIPDRLDQLGFECVNHITGRKLTGRKCQNCKLLKKAEMVLVLTDYVSHDLCDKVKERAKAKGLPVIYCQRSWANIYKKLDFCGFLN